jgi:hypothetical protein
LLPDRYRLRKKHSVELVTPTMVSQHALWGSFTLLTVVEIHAGKVASRLVGRYWQLWRVQAQACNLRLSCAQTGVTGR